MTSGSSKYAAWRSAAPGASVTRGWSPYSSYASHGDPSFPYAPMVK
jgi:hypothetical protein